MSESAPSPTVRAIQALRTVRAKLEALEQARKEPIAIIGMGCRFPGGIENPDAFWDLLRDGREVIAEVPASRWAIDDYYDPDVNAAGKIVTRNGGFLDRVRDFDPQFFGISPREAVSMDPQQHLLLEVCWEALENAGLVPGKLAGGRTGVFIGICNQDYSVLLMSRQDTAIDAYMTTGMAHSVAAGRLAYTLGFQGPCLAVDTACSSSLVAVHLACQSLRNRECDMAVTGGVNLILCPETSINFSRSHMLAPDGRCKTFAAAADGFGRGEGCGLIVLKRLSDVVARRDHVLAVIRGSAINQDGATSGLTVPNGPAQQTVIRDALTNAGVLPEQVDYIEAHGTGTSLGDPIEIGALNAVFGPGRPGGDRLIVGSVKTNLGHLEGAAGISGLMKVVLALSHEAIPPHLHFDTPNPHIPWGEMPIQVADRGRAWPTGDRPRLAGVSSFGFSGSNAHVVLGEAPPADEAEPPAEAERDRHVLTLSARSVQGLQDQARAYAGHLDQGSLPDFCYTANTTRSVFEHRLAVAAADTADMRGKLERFDPDEPGRSMSYGIVREAEPPKIAWLFTGQGSQYPGMGSELYRTQKVFRDAIDECASVLDPLLGRPLTALLFDAAGTDLHQTGFTQPALFALEYALARMWRSWGVRPDAVMGHSVGEYVAACVAGVFSLENGLRLIAARGRLMQALPRDGAMAAVFASPARIAPFIGDVSIAAINSDRETVISGEQNAVRAALAQMSAADMKSQELTVSHAFHSPLMEPMLTEFDRVLREVTLSPPRIPLVSNLTGDFVTREVTDPAWWGRHVREPVLFSDGLARLRRHGIKGFIELGPHPVLLTMARAQTPGPDQTMFYLPSLRKTHPDWAVLSNSLGQLWTSGGAVDWNGFDAPYQRRRTSLPTYRFQRKRYWFTENDVVRARKASPLVEGDPETLARDLAASGELTPEEIALLPKLLRLLSRRQDGPPTDLAYQVAWREAPRAAGRPRETDESPAWLVLSADLVPDLASSLREAGRRPLPIAPARGFERDEADYRGLLDDVGGPLEGVVFAWPADSGSEQDLMRVVRLARALSRLPSPPALWLVTRAAVGIGHAHPASPFPALAWGLGRSLFLEHPALKGGMIDLSARHDAAGLIRELLDPDGEDAIALRDGRRYVARLQPTPIATGKPPPLRPDGTYLITGGLGALGLRAAQQLAAQGAGHLVLMGRRAPTEQVRATLDRLRENGTRISVAQADCADAAALRGVFDRIAADGDTLKGVIHAAGVMVPRSIEELDPELLRTVLAPKVDGAWNLHHLTEPLALDFFVCFSSVSAVLGTASQAAYTAANAFLDGLAAWRRGLGLPALSIGWGPWQGGGLADGQAARRIAETGFKPLSPAVALEWFGRLLGSDQANAIVVDADWPRLKSLYEVRGRQPLLEQFGREAVAETGPSAVLDELHRTPIRERFDFLVGFLLREVSAVLRFEDDATLDPRQGFFDMGLDSLTAVELKTRVETRLRCPLPPSVVFDYPNIEALAGHLLASLFPAEPVAAHTKDQARMQADARLLSDTEIAALIDDELATLVGEGPRA